MINFQDNFETSPSEALSAAGTNSPLNDLPSIDAPFYLAFDADNENEHYEVKLITSKGVGSVNHSALTYDHGASEKVRCVVPSVFLNAIQAHPQGTLVNGKIVPSVDSNNLTVAIKTFSGNDPSATNPVYCRIGDTIRSITSALSVTKNAATNWCNAGSAELATREIDYFVYLGYNATDGVVIGFSRIPYANEYDDFSATTTNEKYCAISTITNAAAGDDYEVIGRFAATLSAGAGYTWSVPTFTAKNLIQRPIYESRVLSIAPVFVGFSTNPTVAFTYKIHYNECFLDYAFVSASGTSNAATFSETLPFSAGRAGAGYGFGANGGSNSGTNWQITGGASKVAFGILGLEPGTDGAGWTTSGSKYAKMSTRYSLV